MAQTITFQPIGIANSRDCSISEATPSTVWGSGTTLRTGRSGVPSTYRSLIGFDLTGARYARVGIPLQSQIVTAALTLYVNSASPSAAACKAVVLRDNATIDPDATTWNSMSSSAAWVAAGGDWSRDTTASFNMPTSTGFTTISGLAALCQRALDYSSGIFSLMLKKDVETTGTGHEFEVMRSRTGYTATPRAPSLTLTYRPLGAGEGIPPSPASDIDGLQDIITAAGWSDGIGDARSMTDGRPATP